MTVSTFYSDTTDGNIQSTSTTYATARSGGGTFAVNTTDDGSSFKPFGQAINWAGTPGLYGVAEAFFSFDTSSIPDTDTIDSAVLSLYFFADAIQNVTSVAEARVHDWGTSLTSADWVAGASLSSKARLAAKASGVGTRYVTNAYTVFDSDAEFVANINTTGSTRMVVVSHLTTENITAAQDETAHPYYAEKGGDFRPKLVVTHTTSGQTITLTQPSETATAQTLAGVTEVFDLGQVSETDSSLGFSISDVVTGLVATAVSSTEIQLTWNEFSGATGYDLERNGVVVQEFLPAATVFLDGGLSPNTTYTYRVRAVI